MFDFFFKRKKVVLDCFTHQKHVFDYCKIDYGNRFMPEWWKKQETFSNGDVIGHETNGMTIKQCSGLIDFYRHAIIIPAWFDARIVIPKITDADHRLTLISSNLEEEPSHPPSQYKHFSLGNGYNYKLKNPWTIKCNKRIKFAWTQPTWNMREMMFNISVLPAVISFYTQHNASINFFYRVVEDEQVFEIEPLQPLVALYALTEDEIELRYHLVDNKNILAEMKDYFRRFDYAESHVHNEDSKKYMSSLTAEEKIKLYRKGKKIRDMILDFNENRNQEIEKNGK